MFCSRSPLECKIERRQPLEEEEDDGEDTSSSSQEFEDVGMREEKALSDSEIKVYIILHFKKKKLIPVFSVICNYKMIALVNYTLSVMYIILYIHFFTDY